MHVAIDMLPEYDFLRIHGATKSMANIREEKDNQPIQAIRLL